MIKKILWKMFLRIFKDKIRIFECSEYIMHNEIVKATTLEEYYRILENRLRSKILDEMARQKFMEIEKKTYQSSMSDQYLVRIVTIKK